MNDKKIDELMVTYADGLGNFNGSVPEKRRRKQVLWKPVMATTCVTATLISVFSLAPRSAKATSMELVVNSLNSAKSWKAEFTQCEGGGKWVNTGSQSYFDGRVRYETGSNSPSPEATVIENGFVYRDYSDMPYILRYNHNSFHLKSELIDPLSNALSKYKAYSNAYIRQDGVQFANKKAYTLSVFGKGKRLAFRAYIEEQSNLPLSVQVNLIGPRGEILQCRSIYTYEEHPDAKLFSPNPSKVLIDPEIEKSSLKKSWSRVPTSKQHPTIYSSSMSTDGSIWIAYGMKKEFSSGWYLASIAGGEYAPTTNYVLHTFTEKQDFRINGNAVIVSRWTPILSEPKACSQISLNFKIAGNSNKNSNGETEIAQVNLNREQWQVPTYLPAFVEHFSAFHEKFIQEFGLAQYLEKKGKYADAASHVDRALATYDRDRFYLPRRTYLLMADMYDKAGEFANAKKLRSKAKKIKQ